MDKKQTAKDLLVRLALDNPVRMMMIETAIASVDETKLDEVIVMLTQRVKEREGNYAEFKMRMSEIIKETTVKKG